MKNLEEIKRRLQEREKDQQWIDLAEKFMTPYLELYYWYQDDLAFVRDYAAQNIAGQDDAECKLSILMWYHIDNGDQEIAAYLLTLFRTKGVIESHIERLSSLYGKDIAKKVMKGIKFPALGSDTISYPAVVSEYLTSMQSHLPLDSCKKTLAGNHHRLDPEQFAPEKEYFAQADSVEDYLANKHQRLIATLQEHCDSGTLWGGQPITQDVVDYVSKHQEIHTGVMKGNKIIVVKMPYAPDAWLKESKPDKKRYLACDCPFVRSAIPQKIKVSSLWCYNEGGTIKLVFDYLFESSLEVELLSSVLDGDESCSFAITLPSPTP